MTDAWPVPATGPGELRAIVTRLLSTRRHLVARSSNSILASLATVVEQWLRPDSKWRRLAEAMLPGATGFSPEMVRFALPFMLEPLRAPAVGQLLDTELGDRRALDGSPGARRLRSPALALHVLPSNLPAHAAAPVVLTLAIKAAALVKAGRADRLFPALLASSISETDAELGACVAACYWQGGDRRCEDVVLDAVDLVVASGDDASLDQLRARTRGRFIANGHRVSFAVLAREILIEPAVMQGAAAALALDVALWDQRGCLSPQLCFVEGDFEAACQFGELLATALRDMARRLPPGPTATAEQVAVRRFREEAEWRAIGGAPCLLFAPDKCADGTVVVEPEAVFRLTPLCRSVRILPLRRMADMVDVLAPARRVVECAGLASAPWRQPECARLLTAAGVHRICQLGEMQRPPLSWQPGGRPRVADWLG